MAFIRSLLFMAIMLLVTPPYALFVILCAPLPHRQRRHSVVAWVALASWLVKHLLGIDYRLHGRENIPSRPCIVLSKHQSAWETLVLQEIFRDTLFVWKKELKYLPFFGWALAVIPMIEVDRGAGKEALKQLADQGRDRLAKDYNIVIFPEGTRVPPGHRRRYKIGGAHLAVATGAPVVPVALNSGEVWGRNALFKRPGTVIVSIGPAIEPAGRSAEDVMTLAEQWIENEMTRISPHLYGGASHEQPIVPRHA